MTVTKDQIEPRYGIIVSQWNSMITRRLKEGAIDYLLHHGVAKTALRIIEVPGAVEIPFAAQCLAQSKCYQAIICLGAVIRGETDHYDYVCQQVSQSCQQIMLAYEVPVIFGILTTHNLTQAYARVGGKAGHKGIEAGATAMQMVKLAAELKAEIAQANHSHWKEGATI